MLRMLGHRRLRPPTPGARMMLWVYPSVTALYGLFYVFQSGDRMQGAAFTSAKGLMPMHVWGLVFLVVALVKVGCILTGTSETYVIMMCLGGALFSTWGFLFLFSALNNSTASFAGCLLPFGWAIAHLAMLATVAARRD